MSDGKTTVEMLEKHFTETLGREVMVSIIQSYPCDNGDVHVITVLYDTGSEGTGLKRFGGRGGHGLRQRQYAQDRTHTVAVLIDESMELPDFSLRSIAGITVPVRDSYGPIRRLEFPDVGEFDKKQKLCCWNTEASRLLFSKDLRKQLASKRGLTYFGSGGKLAVFYSAGVCPDSKLDSFIADANKGLSQIKAAESLIRETDNYNPATEVHHVLDAFNKQHGIRHFTRHIEARHLDALEESEPPRDIPKVIRSKVLAFSYIPIFLTLFTLPFACFFTLLCWDDIEPRVAQVIVVLGPIPFIAAMGTVFYCRNRIIRTLKSGKVFQATMTDIHETGFVIGNDRRFQATVEYMLDGEKQTGVTNVYNLSVSLAKVYCRTSKPVRILVHPTNPSYILCLEMLPHGLGW